ncbi:MAG TPA: histidine phosphatase family protein [Verrucomicrobiae bacterium]|nr:histidine phosphatase family protein [Verrucomicrobiae bacterium]
MAKLILIRHGHTSFNIPGQKERLRGWLDIPLSNEGLAEAEETARFLAGFQIKTIYSSDLTRALQTAQVLSRVVDAPITPTPELRPWNLGAFAGQLIHELLPFLVLLNQQPDTVAPGGESWNQFYDRYSARLLALMELAHESDEHIAAVAHVRNFLTAPTIVLGGDRHQVPVKGGPKTGSVYIIEKSGDKWRIRTDKLEPVTLSHSAAEREVALA